MKVEPNGRGFKQSEELICTYGTKVRVQESSAAMEPHIWIYMDQPHDINSACIAMQTDQEYTGEYSTASAHLTLEQAKEIRDALTHLIENHYHLT